MSDDTVINPKIMSFWFLSQLFRGHCDESHFINFRLIHNKAPQRDEKTGRLLQSTDSMLNINVPVNTFRAEWMREGGLYDQFRQMNLNPEKPANVYYGTAPRTHRTQFGKNDCLGFQAFFLDLDVTENYSFEDRMVQITYWRNVGFEPSFVVNSGHGLQALWIFDKVYEREAGEELLKKMVRLTGCQVKGNCFDITRIMRLPGFKNVKHWYDEDTPDATLILPRLAEVREHMQNKTLVKRYTFEEMTRFPISTKEAIDEAISTVRQMTNGTFQDNLRQIVRSISEHEQQQRLGTALETVRNRQTVIKAKDEAKAAVYDPAPKFNIIPMELEDIPVHRKVASFFKTYCRKGYDGLTEDDLDKIKKRLNLTDVSASELDARIMYQLVRCRYTFEAIENFWHRADIKLYRPDKEARNPRYLEMTYENMFNQFTAVLQQQEVNRVSGSDSSRAIGSIFVSDRHESWVVRPRGEELVTTAEFKLHAIYQDLDATGPHDEEYYDLEVRTSGNNPNKVDTRRLLWRRDVFASKTNFKKNCTGNIFLLSDKDRDLQSLLQHIKRNSNPDVTIQKFHSSMTYDPSMEAFSFPKMLIFKDQFLKPNLDKLSSNLEQKFPWHNLWTDTEVSRDRVADIIRESWEDFMTFYIPEITMGVLGSIAATAMREIMKEHNLAHDMHMPCLNVRGSSMSGKTESIYQLYRFTGCVKPGNARVSLRSTPFAMSRLMQLVRFVPILFDEFKDEGRSTEKALQNFREFLRRTYSGEIEMRGRQDLTLTGQSVHGSSILLGESPLESPGDVAGMTRMLPFDTDAFVSKNTIGKFHRVVAAPIHLLGAPFYQSLLRRDPVEEYRRYQSIRDSVAHQLEAYLEGTSGRVASNIALLCWGCSMVDEFATQYFSGARTLDATYGVQSFLVDHVRQYFETSGSMIRRPNTEPQSAQETRLYFKDEILEFIEKVDQMAQDRPEVYARAQERNVPLIKVDSKHNQLHLNFNALYDIYRQYSFTLNEKCHGRTTLRARLRGAAKKGAHWLISLASNPRFPAANSRPTCIALNLDELKKMGVWTYMEESADVTINRLDTYLSN